LTVTVPAVAVNVAVVAPAATETEVGTLNNGLLLDNTMLMALAGGAESVIVHVDVPALLRLVTVQPSELRVTGGVSAKLACCELLP